MYINTFIIHVYSLINTYKVAFNRSENHSLEYRPPVYWLTNTISLQYRSTVCRKVKSTMYVSLKSKLSSMVMLVRVAQSDAL